MKCAEKKRGRIHLEVQIFPQKSSTHMDIVPNEKSVINDEIPQGIVTFGYDLTLLSRRARMISTEMQKKKRLLGDGSTKIANIY